MKVAEYIVEKLIQYEIRDIFGIPGGVILQFLYAAKSRIPEITPHLSYHEQMAGFAACGYAQAGKKAGAAYASRGPGIINMITSIAEAYQESLPVLFITAHGNREKAGMRFQYNQEIDLLNIVMDITKYAANIDCLADVRSSLDKALDKMLHGRRGPVLLDFSTDLFELEINNDKLVSLKREESLQNNFIYEKAAHDLKKYLSKAKRPVVLIGDGIRQSKNIYYVKNGLEKLKVPIISSRAAQDILSSSVQYYGYIGSHGCRYSNFILAKADLIISVGNRLAFPLKSSSFSMIFDKAKLLRYEMDTEEFQRNIPGSETYQMDVDQFMKSLYETGLAFEDNYAWLDICRRLKEGLNECDVTEPVKKFANILQNVEEKYIYVCDVGNNEFWFSRAFEWIRPQGSVLYSKSFGTLGVALGRAIGAYYATGSKVICIIGDQGLQYNIQELQYIAHWKLPIKVVLLNNYCSGMILDREKRLFGDRLVQVSLSSGYSTPDFCAIANAYGIGYLCDREQEEMVKTFFRNEEPLLYEIKVTSEINLTPDLPKGSPCQNMLPFLEKTTYDFFNKL